MCPVIIFVQNILRLKPTLTLPISNALSSNPQGVCWERGVRAACERMKAQT